MAVVVDRAVCYSMEGCRVAQRAQQRGVALGAALLLEQPCIALTHWCREMRWFRAPQPADDVARGRAPGRCATRGRLDAPVSCFSRCFW